MTIVPDYLSSTKLRDRAEECRVIARTFGDRRTREQMLRIAAGYESMAGRLERGEIAIAASAAEVETRSAGISDG